MKNPLRFIRAGASVAAALFLVSRAPVESRAAAAERPNILYLFADDMGLGDLSCYNPRSAWRTPHLDRLAQEGMRFTDAHSASALCTPSRYALLTGRYAWRSRLKQGVLQGYHGRLIEPGRATVASFLRARGYATAVVGKWHLGLDWVRKSERLEDVDFAAPFGGGPLALGFETFFGISASLDMPPYVWLRDECATRVPTGTIGDSPAPKLWRGGPIGDDFQMDAVQTRFTDEALAFIDRRVAARDGRPFFLYVPLASPHTPVLPTGKFAGVTQTTPYGDFVAQLDADVGRLLERLEKQGLTRNTLVIFTADNGFAPPGGLDGLQRIGHDSSGGFRGVKADLFEGGHRVPFIARWPAMVRPGQVSDALVGLQDLFATSADILGVPVPPDAAEDSVSLLPVLRGVQATARTTLVNHSGEGRFAIREGKWKLLLWPGSGGWSHPTPNPSVWLKVEKADLGRLPPFQLYDLAADPRETKNVAADHPDIVQRLGRKLRADIERGRSTAGPDRPVEGMANWPHTAWFASFK
jgi:arylsulfatase A-like enzyme